ANEAPPTKATPGSTAASGVVTLTHTCAESRDVVAEDAAKIARYIRSEVDARRRRYSDFLILTRKKKGITNYAGALEALNIPLEVSGAGAFGESAEVQALTVLLRAIADPADVLSLINVLRGPLFGVSDRELFAFKQSGGWFSIFFDGAKSINAAAGARVTQSLGALREYYRWTRVLPAPAALERILEHTGYLALAATTPGGVEAGDLVHAVDRVRQVVEDAGSLIDAADSLDADAEASMEVESLPLEPGRTDVVRVMNLHKAKGLEADVVFLADPSGGFSPQVDVHIARTGDVAQGWFQVIRKSTTSRATTLLGEHPDWAVHKAAEEPYLEAEQNRLLYVAATRARQLLVVSRWTGKSRSPAWGALNEFLADAPELDVPATATIPQMTPLDCSAVAQTAAANARAMAHRTVAEPSWSISSVTSSSGHIARMTEMEVAAEDDPTKVVSTDTPAHRADAGMAWGTLIHGLLEHAMRHQKATRDDLRRLAMWLTVEEPQLRKVIDLAIDTVERVRTAEFWQTAQTGEHSAEVPFVINEESVLTSGVIDLLFQSPEGWQVRDYKTDVTIAEDMYERQLDTYRNALRKLGCEVEASLVHVRSPE
ncbi:MAG TPA: 3'-5' exonuclease, partial [Vicinamibacterales bacterium]|nr:3'-5' exonuclease [Vicinamibacterales bacterium]